MSAGEPAAPAPSLLRRALRLGFALLLVGGLVVAVVGQGDAIRDDVRSVRPATLAAALVALLLGLLTSMLSWRAALRALGSPLAVRTAARIFFVGQLGKYLPGSVWPLLTQMQLARAAGVPRSRTASAGLVALGLSVATGLLVGLLCAPALLQARGGGYVAASVALLVAAAVGLHPAVVNRVLSAGLRLTRRPPLERPLSLPDVLVPVGHLLLTWLAFGAQAYLLVRAVGGSDVAVAELLLATGAFALASTLGLLFVVAPAGAGVREVVLVLALSPVLTTSQATTVAVLSRLLATLADGAVAGLAVLLARRQLHLDVRAAGRDDADDADDADDDADAAAGR